MESNYPKIALQGTDGLMFVKKTEVLYAIADGNYTHVYLTKSRKAKVLRKLKEVAQLLSDVNFIRIHRSHLINIEHIVQLDDSEMVEMCDGFKLTVARNRKTNFIEKFTRI